jgi:phage tail-like protein
MPPTAAVIFPQVGFAFHVVVDGIGGAAFSEVSGLEANVKFDEVRAGGENGFVYRLPTRTEFGNLTLKRGWVDTAFFRWLLDRAAQPHKNTRKKVTVHLMDRRTKEPVVGGTWTFVDAFPVKWSGPSLKAGDNAVAIESLELAHHGFQPKSTQN